MATMSSWTEGILLSLAFVTALGFVVGSFNLMYGMDNSLGLNDTSGSQALFVQYQDTSDSKIQGGEVDFNAQQGITLKSSYGLVKDLISIIWKFVTGGWIETVIGFLGLGEAGTALAVAFRIIFFVSVVGALLFALFKVVV